MPVWLSLEAHTIGGRQHSPFKLLDIFGEEVDYEDERNIRRFGLHADELCSG